MRWRHLLDRVCDGVWLQRKIWMKRKNDHQSVPGLTGAR
jgi:hypothetical protein